LHKYVYITNKVFVNDITIPIDKSKVYFCEAVVEHNLYTEYDIYLLVNITNPDMVIWVQDKEIVVIPEIDQLTFEIIYGCKGALADANDKFKGTP
jgi:hypothetical protein